MPIPWLIIRILNPFASHERLDVPPTGIVLGAAVKDFTNGIVPSVNVFTVTVVSFVSVPKVLTADNL